MMQTMTFIPRHACFLRIISTARRAKSCTEGYRLFMRNINTQKRKLYGKTRYSAFAGTDLELKLREWQITELHLACTDICVLHTAVDAYNKGFQIVIHQNAVSFNPEGHECTCPILRTASERKWQSKEGKIILVEHGFKDDSLSLHTDLYQINMKRTGETAFMRKSDFELFQKASL